jgi:hypothetical protein
MPRLLRSIGRTAAVVGTATAVSGRVSRRQAGRWAQQDTLQEVPQAAPAAAAGNTGDKLAQLKTLGELKDQGVLTEAEFVTQKATILGS